MNDSNQKALRYASLKCLVLQHYLQKKGLIILNNDLSINLNTLANNIGEEPETVLDLLYPLQVRILKKAFPEYKKFADNNFTATEKTGDLAMAILKELTINQGIGIGPLSEEEKTTLAKELGVEWQDIVLLFQELQEELFLV